MRFMELQKALLAEAVLKLKMELIKIVERPAKMLGEKALRDFDYHVTIGGI